MLVFDLEEGCLQSRLLGVVGGGSLGECAECMQVEGGAGGSGRLVRSLGHRASLGGRWRGAHWRLGLTN